MALPEYAQIVENIKSKIPNAEFDDAGDYYRVPTQNGTVFWGGAGIPHEYDFFKIDRLTGNAEQVSPGEHREAEGYFWAGLNTGQYTQAVREHLSGTTSAISAARLANPDAIGQAVSRSDLVGLNSYGLEGAEKTFYLAETPWIFEKTGLPLTEQEYRSAQAQIAQSTPAAQAARNGGGGMGSLGILATVAMVIAAIYTGGAALGFWGAAEGGLAAGGLAAGEGLAGAAAAETSVAGFGAGALGSGVSVGTSAGVGSGLSFAGAGVTAAEGAAVAGYGAGTLGGGLSMSGVYGVGSGLSFAGAGVTAGMDAVNATSPSWFDSMNSATQPVRQANSVYNTVNKLTSTPAQSVKPSVFGSSVPQTSGFLMPVYTGGNAMRGLTYDVVQPSDTAPALPAVGIVAAAGLLYLLVK